MDLIKLLTDQLRVNENQARGGAGLIFDMVQKQVGSEDFAKISAAIPQVSTWINHAPTESSEGGGMFGMAGSLAAQLGLDGIGELASLAGGFKKLNLDPDMAAQFVPVIMKYVEGLGGGDLKSILAKVLPKG
ncbi:MAG: DUF2780 domain-containing protein [Planctomycetaceae bacterium]